MEIAEEKGNSVFFGLERCRSATRRCPAINTLFFRMFLTRWNIFFFPHLNTTSSCFYLSKLPSVFERSHSWEVFRNQYERLLEIIHNLKIAVQLWHSWFDVYIWAYLIFLLCVSLVSCMLSKCPLCFVHQVGRGEKLWWDIKKILGKPTVKNT